LMITTVKDLVSAVKHDLQQWNDCCPTKLPVKPWFRGESDPKPERVLNPKISQYPPEGEEENYFVQSFRQRAGGLVNTPHRNETDIWLFLAQHYGLPTRLLDWTEGALIALYFAVNEIDANQEKDKKPENKRKPFVYMLNPHALNREVFGEKNDNGLDIPLTWSKDGSNPKPGYANIALAWEHQRKDRGFDLPYAIHPTYNDMRMIAQKSCFTVHGHELKPMRTILSEKNLNVAEFIREFEIDPAKSAELLMELSILGITASTIFPELGSLAKDMVREVEARRARIGVCDARM